MRMYKPKHLFLIILFTFSLAILLFPLKAKGISDISFTFEKDVLYAETEPDFFINKLSNVKNSSEFTGHYNATFSFENDIDGTEPEGIIIAKNQDCYALINESLSGHNKILNMSDYNNAGLVNINIEIAQDLDTIVEFWFTKSSVSVSRRIEITFKEGATSIVQLRFDNDDSQYYNGSVYKALQSNFMEANKFSHFKFILDDTANTFDCYINGILVSSGAGLTYWNPTVSGIDEFGSTTNSANSGYSGYFDAIGYSNAPLEIDDFSDESINDEPSGWSISNGANTFSNITATLDGRVKPLGLFDGGGVGTEHHVSVVSRIFPESNNPNIQNIQFDIAKSSLSPNHYETFIYFNFSGSTIINLLFVDEDLFYFDGFSHHAIKLDFLTANIFSVIRIDFNHTLDSFDLYINGILEGNNINYIFSVNQIDDITIQTSPTESLSFTSYFDNFFFNIGLSYEIDDNFIPFLEINETIKEVDRFEFAYSDFETLYAVGSDIYSGWTEIDTVDDDVNIKANPLWNSDRVISIKHFAPSPLFGGIVGNFDLHGNIINVSWSFEFQVWNPTNKYFLRVRSFDNTLISEIYFENNQLKYTDFNDDEIFLRLGLTTNEIYTLNLYINYADNITILRLSIDGTPTNSYIIPLMEGGKEGLNTITSIAGGSVATDMELDIDYIGVYINNTSASFEFAHIRINDFIPFVPLEFIWNFNDFNLVDFHIIGNSSLWISESNPYLLGISQIYEFAPNSIYTSLDTANIYGSTLFHSSSTLETPSIWFQFYNQFQFISINIEGVRLIEGVNKYSLIQETEGVDNNNSFFRAVGNQLTFTHTSDDSNLELIQASFDINEFSTDGYTTSFRSFIDDNAFGFFRLNFTDDTSNIIPFPSIMTTTRFIPTQNKTIREIIILISDRDIDSVSGKTTGFISNIEFIVSTDIGVSILITALILMIIPLLMILIPSISISQVYGKILLIPIFLLMSVICVATRIIPIWLFFIIGFSSTIFILKAKEVEGLD